MPNSGGVAELKFTKMQGAGNDFVVVLESTSGMTLVKKDPPKAARWLCDRRRGVGADQLLIVSESQMDIWNADGSRAEMCGNGVRCAAEFLNLKLGVRPEWRLNTLAGLQVVRNLGPERWSVQMGVPRLGIGFVSPTRVDLDEDSVFIHEVNVGNPHAVLFVDDVEEVPLERLGPELEFHERFAPERTNVEFVECLGGQRIKVRVWERGAGITQACGTGATASAVAAISKGLVEPGAVVVQMPGGRLEVQWAGDGQPAILSGDARVVFEGSVQLSILDNGLI